MPVEAWGQPTKALYGTRPLAAGVAARWLEVEVHHVDLGVGYEPADWPVEFVGAAVPAVLAGLPGRAQADGTTDSWLLWCSDLSAGWHIDAAAKPAVVSAQESFAGAPAAMHTVTGAGHDVLAWLMGRTDGTGLTVGGERSAALALPGHFPFP